MFTDTHHEIIANAIKNYLLYDENTDPDSGIVRLIVNLADMFGNDNPKCNRVKFINSTGYPDTQIDGNMNSSEIRAFLNSLYS